MTDSHFSDGLGEDGFDAGPYKMQDFVLCYLDEMKKFLPAFKERRLRPRDAAVLFTLLCFHNPKTGLCHVSVTHLAETLDSHLSDVSSSISRLKKTLLVTTYVDKVSGQRSFLVNPYLFASGGKKKRAFLRVKFTELING